MYLYINVEKIPHKKDYLMCTEILGNILKFLVFVHVSHGPYDSVYVLDVYTYVVHQKPARYSPSLRFLPYAWTRCERGKMT